MFQKGRISMEEKKVLVLSAINPTKAYACVKYLYNVLIERKIDVELWSAVPVAQKNEYAKWGEKVNSFFYSKLSNIPKFRMLYMKINPNPCR